MSLSLNVNYFPNRDLAELAGNTLSVQLLSKAIEQNRLPSRISSIHSATRSVLGTVAFIPILLPFIVIGCLGRIGITYAYNPPSERRSQFLRKLVVEVFTFPILFGCNKFVCTLIRIAATALGILNPKISAYGMLLTLKITLIQQRFHAYISSKLLSNISPPGPDAFDARPIKLTSELRDFLGKEVCLQLFKEIYSSKYPEKITVKAENGTEIFSFNHWEEGKDRKDEDTSFGYYVFPEEQIKSYGEDMHLPTPAKK